MNIHRHFEIWKLLDKNEWKYTCCVQKGFYGKAWGQAIETDTVHNHVLKTVKDKEMPKHPGVEKNQIWNIDKRQWRKENFF